MIVKYFYKIKTDGTNLYRTYSDEGFKIQKVGTGEIYDEAVDIEDTTYSYVETDIKIEEENYPNNKNIDSQ